jgi:hypothetical protein
MKLLVTLLCTMLLAGCEKVLDQQYKTAMEDSGDSKVQEVVQAHKASIHHRAAIMRSASCGCFHCLEIFTPSDITEWTDTAEPEPRHTALCPECGIDSVLGSDSGYPITKDFLSGMKSHWF